LRWFFHAVGFSAHHRYCGADSDGYPREHFLSDGLSRQKNPQVGLVKSQQLELATLAGGFKKYLEYDPDAKLSIEAHADVRASKTL